MFTAIFYPAWSAWMIWLILRDLVTSKPAGAFILSVVLVVAISLSARKTWKIKHPIQNAHRH